MICQQSLQGSEHLLVGHPGRALCDNLVRGFIEHQIDDCRKAVRRSDPDVGIVADALLLELEGNPIPNIGSDVLFVDQQLMDGTPRPGPPEIRQDTPFIQAIGDLRFVSSF